jgi:gliding motility-associated-like protein
VKLLRIIILLLSLAWTGATAQTTFQAVNQSGCAPFGAVIHNTTGNTSNTFLWELTSPNGTVATSTSPSYIGILTTPGSYNVTLTINGATAETINNYITVYASPTASFQAEDAIGCYPHCTNFNNTSISGSAEITSYTWDFGDGTTSTEAEPNHCYDNTGVYTPVLSINDANGCFSNLSYQAHIQVVENNVNASFIHSEPDYCEAPVAMTFSSTSSASSISNSFNFGDGTADIINNSTVSHTFNSVGTYEVCITSYNNIGCSDENCQTISIQDTPNPIITSSDYVICAGDNTTFSINSSPNPISRDWDFNEDGVIDSHNAYPTYTFNTPGTYTPTLTCTYASGCVRETSCPEITVLANPVATITSENLSSCSAPFTPTITSSASGNGPLQYLWSVNNAAVANTENLDYSFSTSGLYPVSFQVTDINGCTTIDNSPGLVLLNTPEINFVHYTTACVDQSFSISDLVITTNSPVAAYNWDFNGDGTSDSNSSDPEYFYSTAGTYAMSLAITTQDGCNAIYYSQDSIYVLDSLETGFTWNYTNTCAAQFIEFCAPENTSSRYSWNFGDGTGWNPTNNSNNCVMHTYTDTGYYNIRYRVTQGACLFQDTLPNFIHISPPIAKFSYTVSCDDSRTVTFIDESIGATQLTWDFGDDTPLVYNDTIVTHTYEEFGVYQVHLIAGDGNAQCDFEETHVINLQAPDASIIPSTLSGCAPLYVDIETVQDNKYWEVSISNGDSFIADWLGSQQVWDIQYTHSGILDEYQLGEGANIWPTFSFSEQGCYDFSILTYDRFNCPDTASYNDLVCTLSNQNFADFTSTVLQNCEPVQVSFDAFGENIESVSWNYGDGSAGSGMNVTHDFTPPFNLNSGLQITMTATDTSGCQTTSTHSPELVLPSIPNFIVASATTCLGQEVEFSNMTSGPVESYAWTFGDDASGELNFSSEENPVHVYNQNGTYTVCLTVISPSGCEKTVCKEDIVIVSNPEVAFDYTSNMNNCMYGVTFSSTTLGNNVSYDWSFGDGQIGNGSSTFHTYPIGVYAATLTVVGENGCVDSLTISDIFNYGNQIGQYTVITEELTCAPFHVEFQAFDPTDTYFTYFWDFADGTGVPAGEVNVEHDYLEIGEFCPQLIMTDPNGCEVFIPCTNPIQVDEFEITHNIPPVICSGDYVTVSLMNGESYTWNNLNFVEQGSSSSEFIIHPIESVDFVITGALGDCQNVDTVHVEVNQLPLVTLSLPEEVCYGSESFAIAGGSPIGSTGIYSLNGANIEAFSPSQLANDWYVINYNYTDSNGCISNAQDSIFIRPLPVVTLNQFAPVCANSPEFNLGGGAPESGVYSIGNSLVNTFDPATGFGNYNVSYTFTDDLGCVATAQSEIVVHSVPEIVLSYGPVCANSHLNLTNNSTTVNGIITSTEWTFGDQETFIAQNPGAIQFSEIGENLFHVKTTTSFGCIAELDTTVYVHAVPVTNFSIEDGCAGADLQFASQSAISEGLVDSFVWEFNENVIGTSSAITHAFSDWGSQTLTLISISESGCSDTLSQQVNVYPGPSLNLFANEVCLGETSVMSATIDMAYGTIENTNWTIQDSIISVESNSVNYLFGGPGSYTAYLTAQSDLGCTSTDSISVHVHGIPVVEFTSDLPSYCPDMNAQLFDLSSVDSPGSLINEWAWYFDGELMSVESNPVVPLGGAASYDVTLHVSTNYGCNAEMTLGNFLTVHPSPTAGFVIDHSEVNMANPFVEVINTSSNDVTNWTYDFGDGMVEMFEEGVHEYSDWTNYSIIQTVSNTFGCTDVAQFEVTVLPSLIVNIPNAFTPDGNGNNDIFYPVIYGSEVLEFGFDVYDRWGRLIYSAESTLDGWDGTIRSTGEMSPCGVYNWKMRIRTVDQPLVKQTMGSVMLIK